MSRTKPNELTSGVALIVGVVVVFCFTVAAVVAVTVAVPDGANAATLITLLLGSLAPTIASLVGLAKLSAVGDRVDVVAAQSHDLTNGLMDSKIRAAVADVLSPEMVDESARPQIAADRARRDQRPTS